MPEHEPDSLFAPACLHLSEACDLRGTLRLRGDLLLEGSFDGNLELDGCLRVAPGATLSGSVRATRMEVDGIVQATVRAEEGVWLGRHGELRGSVSTPRVQPLHERPAPAAAPPNAARPAESPWPADPFAEATDDGGDEADEADPTQQQFEQLAEATAQAQAQPHDEPGHQTQPQTERQPQAPTGPRETGPVGVLHRRRRPSARPMASAAAP